MLQVWILEFVKSFEIFLSDEQQCSIYIQCYNLDDISENNISTELNKRKDQPHRNYP